MSGTLRAQCSSNSPKSIAGRSSLSISPDPPPASDKGQDFRTLPEAPPPAAEALLGALLRDVQVRQGLVRAALEEAEEDEELPFVGSAKITDGVEAVVAAMRAILGVSLDEFRQQRTLDDAFKLLREGAERAGVFMLLMGNLGSHHTGLDARAFRGFALADPIAPFVVINENDSRAAWSFTLLHELAHLWLGQTGVSGYDGEGEAERFCDAVAAQFLLDPHELSHLAVASQSNLSELKAEIDAFARARKLSRKMVRLQSAAGARDPRRNIPAALRYFRCRACRYRRQRG